jgi:hypothetical protein
MNSKFPGFKPVVAKDFEWHSDGTDSQFLQRRAIGAEVANGSGEGLNAGQHDLYIWATVKIEEPDVTLIKLRDMLKLVLMLLRFQHPEVACTYSWDGDLSPFIHYHSPRNHEEAMRWAEDLVHVQVGTKTGLKIRDELQEAGKAGRLVMPLEIYLVAPVSAVDGALGNANVEFVFRTNHLSTDGIGIRLMVGEIFRMLGTSEDMARIVRNIRWGDEYKNLAPPLLSVLGDNQAISGADFEKNSMTYAQSASLAMVSASCAHAACKGSSNGRTENVEVKSTAGPWITSDHFPHILGRRIKCDKCCSERSAGIKFYHYSPCACRYSSCFSEI